MAESGTRKISIQRKFCPKCYGQYENIDTCPYDGAELRGPDNDPLIGTVFAERYDILSMIGCGGMSVVYKAKHRLMDRLVAIKMLHGNIKYDPVSLERFRLEAQAAASLSHHNIIAVHDFGVSSENEAYFVMDYLDGESLDELLQRKNKLPWERAVTIFKQVADGLGAAHKKSIIHRDLKPANVVLIKEDDGSELAKLVDFGIAKLLAGAGKEQQNLTKTGDVFGSPIYMSPEQCLGKQLDRRSDIYSFGCLMYETLTGAPPLMGTSYLETMNKQVDEPPRPIAQAAPDANVPPQLESIILRCLAKDPSERYQTCEEIRDQLSTVSALIAGTATGAQRAAISGPVKGLTNTQATATLEHCPEITKAKKASAIWKIVAGTLAVLIAGSLTFFAFWPGPPEDHGTLLSKMLWQFGIARGSDAMSKGEYGAAEKSLSDSVSRAETFGDGKARLEATLKIMGELYSKWEGHAEALEKINIEISTIQTERVREEFKRRLAFLSKLDQIPADSPVARTNAQLKAEAEVPSILSTASKLSGRRMFIDEAEFLEKALAVERKLAENSPTIVTLEAPLADAYINLRNFPKVRPLLLHVCAERKKNLDRAPTDYLRSCLKLGQFDLDQSDMTDAQGELSEAVKLAKEKKVGAELQALCLRSYADLMHQTKRERESVKLLQEAAALEKKSQAN